MSAADHILYALLWLSFGLAHSVLASLAVKGRLEDMLGNAYRFSYNIFATVHLAVVWLAGMFWLGADAAELNWPGPVSAILIAMQLAGLAIAIAALLHYDLGRFSGLTQLRKPEDAPIKEPLNLTGMHRYVRHPLYLGVYLVLIGRISSELDIATAFWACLYLAIGTYFEERKLLRLYGKAYEDYRRDVPAIIPWRGRAI